MSTETVTAERAGSQRHPRYQPEGQLRRHAYKAPVIDARLFYDPTDGRKWKRRCEQKRAVWIAFLDISHGSMKTCAVEKQIGRLKGIPPRTVRWIIRLLRRQGFLRDVRKHGLRDALERELLPGRLGRHPSPNSESCRTSTCQSCRVNAVGELHSAKRKHDSQDSPRQKTVAAGAGRETSNSNSPASKTYREIFETACRVPEIGPDSAMWTLAGALKYGADNHLPLVACLPATTEYYRRANWNRQCQYHEHVISAMYERAPDRLRDQVVRFSVLEQAVFDTPRVVRNTRSQDLEPLEISVLTPGCVHAL